MTPDPGPLHVQTPTARAILTPGRPHVLGRARDADVVVEDTKVSRRHLLLEPGPDGWLARDTSANGVWRDGKRIETAGIGAVAVRLRLGSADGPSIVLSAPATALPPPVRQTDDDLMSAAETHLARPGGSRAAAPQAPAQPSGSKPPAPKPPTRWARLVPTLLWLAATGFAIGALIALS